MFGPQEPTVKILKRPTKTTDNQATTDQPVRRHKTLQEVCLEFKKFNTPYKTGSKLLQREQEYAEARLRILGAAHSPLDTNPGNDR